MVKKIIAFLAVLIGIVANFLYILEFAEIRSTWGFQGTNNFEKNFSAPAIMPYEEHRMSFIISAILILLFLILLITNLPKSRRFGSIESISADGIIYRGGVQALMASFACVVPFIWIWIHNFFLQPTDKSLFLVVLIALLVLTILSIVSGFENALFKLKSNLPLTILLISSPTLVVAYGFSNWSLSFSITVASSLIIVTLLYWAIMLKFAKVTFYSVPSPGEVTFTITGLNKND